ncbi:hypothetical protein Nepgr_001072 [Nepenthes gracilis]|uniref:Uncharacterized protein n=1 Tax=Nepenthes gracilis TaxID=150966 RepID=A0AAD3P4J3_NEPGR|nr:hypothetical protein Nepgr_001072 [Nepenthes gracilis]
MAECSDSGWVFGAPGFSILKPAASRRRLPCSSASPVMAGLLRAPPVPPQVAASPVLPDRSRSRASLSSMGNVLIRPHPGSTAASSLISGVLPAVTPSSRFDIVQIRACWCYRSGIWPVPGYYNLPVSVCGHVEGELSISLLPLIKSSPAGWLPVHSRPECKLAEMLLQLPNERATVPSALHERDQNSKNNWARFAPESPEFFKFDETKSNLIIQQNWLILKPSTEAPKSITTLKNTRPEACRVTGCRNIGMKTGEKTTDFRRAASQLTSSRLQGPIGISQTSIARHFHRSRRRNKQQ